MCVVQKRQHGGIHAAGEKLVLGFATHRHLLPFLDDGFDFLYGEAAEAAH